MCFPQSAFAGDSPVFSVPLQCPVCGTPIFQEEADSQRHGRVWRCPRRCLPEPRRNTDLLRTWTRPRTTNRLKGWRFSYRSNTSANARRENFSSPNGTRSSLTNRSRHALATLILLKSSQSLLAGGNRLRGELTMEGPVDAWGRALVAAHASRFMGKNRPRESEERHSFCGLQSRRPATDGRTSRPNLHSPPSSMALL